MLQNDLVFNLIATIKSTKYLIGIIKISTNGEIFYFFKNTTTPIKKVLNCDTGLMDYPFDHVSFHTKEKYVIHIAKIIKKNKKEYVDREPYHGPIFLNEPIITPFYVESIRFQSEPPLVHLSEFRPWRHSQSQEISIPELSKGFSLIFMLVPASHYTSWILNGIQFYLSPMHRLRYLVDADHKVTRIPIWGEWDLMIIPTPFLNNILSPIPKEFEAGFRLINYKNVPAALTDLMFQAYDEKYWKEIIMTGTRPWTLPYLIK